MSESKKSAEQVERERLTRRQALRKFGFGAGLSAIMLLGADDLARMVGERMRQMEGDNRVADQIAREFQRAGVALASPTSTGDPCQDCWNHYVCVCENCDCYSPGDASCKQKASDQFNACKTAKCPPGTFPDGSVQVACIECGLA